jgi:hypothetical protein
MVITDYCFGLKTAYFMPLAGWVWTLKTGAIDNVYSDGQGEEGWLTGSQYNLLSDHRLPLIACRLLVTTPHWPKVQ